MQRNHEPQWAQISRSLQSTATSLRKLIQVAELLAEHNADIQFAMTNCCDQLHRMGELAGFKIVFFPEKRFFVVHRFFDEIAN